MKVTHLGKNQVTWYDDSTGERVFQSYNSIICKVNSKTGKVTLGRHWNYSVTTAKYRNQFLNETTKETQAKIDSGEYVVDESLL